MGTTGKSLLFGLIGDPVAHSLSPFIMNRAFATASRFRSRDSHRWAWAVST
jgi:shikimate 5-dehydrogenase